MLFLGTVRPRFSLVFAAAFAAALALVSSVAGAQTTGPTVSQAPNQVFPERYLHYGTAAQQDLGQSTRPAGLNPDGINYDDCISDMTLVWPLELSGFTGQSLEIWVTTGGTCTNDPERGNGGVADCWLVGSQVINQPATFGYSFAVRVQDLVGSQQIVPNPPVYTPRDSSACQSQPTESSQNFVVYFVPVSGVTAQGTAYQQTITADLVGPTPPVGVSIADGDTLFVVNWTANTDADTAGYDVFIDPIPGSGQEASVATGTTTTRLVCPDSGSASEVGALDADSAEASDATLEAVAPGSLADAGCYTINVGPSSPTPGSTTCGSGILQSANVQDGGVISIVEDEAATETFDEAGNLITTTETGNVGICTIPCQYLYGASCAFGQPVYTSINNPTLASEGNGSYTIKGLTNGTTYNVVVAAVDASGNVGPPSPEVCDYPAPVNDFFKNYTNDGGKAGGGFCALEAVGMPASSAALFGGLGAAFLGAARRRRRRRAALEAR
jgi:hypothetical protein